MAEQQNYPVTFNIEYPGKMSRLSLVFRLILAIPIFVIFTILTDSSGSTGGALWVV